MRYTLRGPFTAREQGGGLWQVIARAPSHVEVYLRIAAPTAGRILNAAGANRLDLLWRDVGVSVTVTGGGGEGNLIAESAVVHEAKAALYQQLPLAAFDRKAARFWGRVFTLLRFPGGRYLLRFVARRR